MTSGDVRSNAALASSLRNSVMRLSRRLRIERASTDLGLNQLAVLGTLRRHGSLTVGELAAAERVRPPSMTRTVNCLCDLGLARREPHATDRRQVVVHLTDEAQRVLEEDRRRRDAWLARQLAGLSADERRQLREVAPLLDRLGQV